MRPRVTYANVVATLALFVALGGTSYAAYKLGRNSVRSENIGREQVKAADIAKDAISSPKVKDGSLLPVDFKAGTLPAVGPAGPKGDRGAQGERGPQGAVGISGLERISILSGTDSVSPKKLVVECAPGKTAISGGYDIEGAKEGVTPNGLANIVADMVEPSIPKADATGTVTVEAWEVNSTSNTWGLNAIAICANME